MTTLREAAMRQALEALMDAQRHNYALKHKETDDLITALKAALAEPQSTHSADCFKWHHKCAVAEVERLRAALAEPCPCGDRPAAQCPGEWEPGCDLGNNPEYAKRVEMTPKELAASIKRGEKWKVAEPVQENKDA